MVEKKLLAKVIVIGDLGVGKSTLTSNYVDNRTSVQGVVTMGPDFRKKDIKVGNTNVTLQIWDTAGQEKFNSINFAFYRGTNCCIIVFDLNDEETFENLSKWKREFLQKANPKNPGTFPFVVIGNKTDLPRRVDEGQAREWCRTQGNIDYFETWGDQGIMVSSAFSRAAELCVREMEDQKGFDEMPAGLYQAQGAIKMNARDDNHRSMIRQEETSSNKCC